MPLNYELPEHDFISYLHEIFEYKDGQLIRRKTLGGQKRGSVAGSKHWTGYWIVRVRNKLYQRSHIIWALCKGAMPEEIDHIDQDKDNEDITNLRIASRHQNCANRQKWMGREKYKGVYETRNGKFSAQITCKGVRETLGTFSTPEEARDVYDARAKELFKEFASPNA